MLWLLFFLLQQWCKSAATYFSQISWDLGAKCRSKHIRHCYGLRILFTAVRWARTKFYLFNSYKLYVILQNDIRMHGTLLKSSVFGNHYIFVYSFKAEPAQSFLTGGRWSWPQPGWGERWDWEGAQPLRPGISHCLLRSRSNPFLAVGGVVVSGGTLLLIHHTDHDR